LEDEMINYFQGEDGKKRLIDAICKQQIVCENEDLATKIANIGEIREYVKGETLILHFGTDCDIYFIIAGTVDIIVNQRVVASRSSGWHVGEMALIDPSALRSADVVATEPIVACVVNETDFTKLADEMPYLWRRIAIELADRLRQRNLLALSANPRPHLFIGSSSESLSVARAIQRGLENDFVTIKVWTDGVFGSSNFSVEPLESEIRSADFGLLVLAPEDKVICQELKESAPKDNFIFELGMCIGALTQHRSFIAYPAEVDIRIPIDLLGLTPLTYEVDPDDDWDSALNPVCEKIRRIISESGVK
jgi:predicted nucleotide-binding protein